MAQQIDWSMQYDKYTNNIQEELLVIGYCRNVQIKILNNTIVPTSIMDICLKFYSITHIITIPIGQCGIAFNLKFLDSILTEYNIDKNNGKPIDNDKKSIIDNTYLRKENDGYFMRALFVDTVSG